ncbi:MAG: ABC transporter ATP-binding protein [Chloroflexi bacterium]|nr:ABC transporter ATP-binding protein [Chloroflexota bacterium]
MASGLRGRSAGRPQAANKETPVKFTRRGFQRLLGFALPYWYLLVGAGVAMLIGSLTGLALPAIAGSLIDTVFLKGDPNGLNQATLFLVGAFIIQAISAFIQNFLLSYTGERVVTNLRISLYAHLQKLPLGFFNERRTGDLISRLTNDVSQVQTAVTSNLISMVSSLVTLVGGVVIIVTRDWRLTLLIMGLIPVLVGVGFLVGMRLRRLSQAVSTELGAATTTLEETLSNEKTVKAFTREDYEVNRYTGRIEKVFRLAIRRARLQSGFMAVMMLLVFTAVAAVLWFGGHEVLAGHITPGELVSILIYMGVVAAPVGALAGLFGELQKALGSAERIFSILDEPVTVADAPNALPLPPLRGELRFENVWFEYDAATPVLENLSFVAEPGQVLALVGPSGAGKTTIANLIPRFFDPTGGRILVDGYDIRQVQVKGLREQISTVLQEPVLFGSTIRENIVYGRLDATEAEIVEAARAANALEFIEKLPEKFDTVVGERGVKLSGGQRQRIAIARAILRNPRILILDEATSSLDNESESLVQEALDRLMRERTTVVIAHRLSTIENADKIVVIDQGRLVEQGNHPSLMDKEGLYYRLYTRNFTEEVVGV